MNVLFYQEWYYDPLTYIFAFALVFGVLFFTVLLYAFTRRSKHNLEVVE